MRDLADILQNINDEADHIIGTNMTDELELSKLHNNAEAIKRFTQEIKELKEDTKRAKEDLERLQEAIDELENSAKIADLNASMI